MKLGGKEMVRKKKEEERDRRKERKTKKARAAIIQVFIYLSWLPNDFRYPVLFPAFPNFFLRLS